MLKQKRPLRNLELRLAYMGSSYFGWQIQPHVPTIQGEIAAALKKTLGEPAPKTTGTSRTDAGVHAHDQRVNFRTENPIPTGNLLRALNLILPQDIRVLDVYERPANFSCRRNARAKHYAYFIHNHAEISPFSSPLVWLDPLPLDAARMHRAAQVFVGSRCFRGLQSSKDFRRNARAEIFAARVARHGRVVCFETLGSRFLYHMVRNMVSALVKVGRGDWTAEELRDKLDSGERKRFWITAPAAGLHLFKVYFDPPPYQFSPDCAAFLKTLASPTI